VQKSETALPLTRPPRTTGHKPQANFTTHLALRTGDRHHPHLPRARAVELGQEDLLPGAQQRPPAAHRDQLGVAHGRMVRMNLVAVGLALVLLSALMALATRRWSSPAVLGVVTGLVLAAFGFWSSPRTAPAGTVLASDRAPAIENEGVAASETKPQPAETPAGVAEAGEGANEALPEAAPAIPEHVIPGAARAWVGELAKLVGKPNRFPLAQSGDAPPGAPNEGDRIYEYVNLELAGRTLQTVFLSKNPGDPGTWMVHVEPGAQGAPIQPEELGKVRVLGEGGNFVVFKIEDGPLAGNYLVWATGGHRGGGEAVRVYSPRFLEREQGLAQQIARAAGE